MRPLERFLHIEAASGLLLLGAALVALVWANSPWRHAYERLWHTTLTVGAGRLTFAKPLHFWINDALMVFFFVVVGPEIRREMHDGELSDARRAALPVAAALGGAGSLATAVSTPTESRSSVTSRRATGCGSGCCR